MIGFDSDGVRMRGVLLLFCLIAEIAFAADCQVRFLNPGNADEIDEGFRSKIIPRTGDYQKAVVREALNAVPLLVCAAVTRVVFVHDPGNDGIVFVNTTSMINRGRPADLIYFNNAAMPETQMAGQFRPRTVLAAQS